MANNQRVFLQVTYCELSVVTRDVLTQAEIPDTSDQLALQPRLAEAFLLFSCILTHHRLRVFRNATFLDFCTAVEEINAVTFAYETDRQ